MVDRDNRYNKLRKLGFYFKKDKLFDNFLDKIEKYSKEYDTPEINFYNAFIYKLMKYKNLKEGEPPPKSIPLIRALLLDVNIKQEQGKDPADKYKITAIHTNYIKKLREHKNRRYP
jgi:hypothetical protein